MATKQKIARIMGITGWTTGHMANLLGVGSKSLWLWTKGRTKPKEQFARKIDWLHAELVEPFICEIETRADIAEKKLLQDKIKGLADDNVCKS